jgi:hypothetical protein
VCQELYTLTHDAQEWVWEVIVIPLSQIRKQWNKSWGQPGVELGPDSRPCSHCSVASQEVRAEGVHSAGDLNTEPFHQDCPWREDSTETGIGQAETKITGKD